MRDRDGLLWRDLSFWDRTKLINKFSIIVIIGNLCQLIGTLLYFISPVITLTESEIFIGFGCFFAWVSLTRYFMYSQRHSLILRTVEFAFPILIRAVLGILPYFIGYAILGQCLFWEVNMRFLYFSTSFMALFCMMNGDNLVPISEDAAYIDLIWGNFYCYFFIFCSIM